MKQPSLLRVLGVLVIVALVVALDQFTKWLARIWLAPRPPFSLLNDLVRLGYAENEGALLSLGADLPPALRSLLFVGAVSVVLAFMLIAMLRSRHIGLHQLVSLSLVTGGGLGNLIDRVLNNGAVVDFANLGIGPLRTGIFNLADVAIVAGLVLFLWGAREKTEIEPEPSKG